MQTLRDGNCNRKRSILHLCGRIGEEKGQALVELALTVPALVLLLVGAAELARVSYASIEVSNAALAGVQYGAQTSTTAGDTIGIQTAASVDAPDLSSGLLITTVSKSCICSNGAASTCLSTDCSGAYIETILTVKTQASVNPLIHLPGIPSTFTLRGQAIQKVLQ
jgi:Flp pilus assembly protein TadG